ncbi:MAG: hypothetical protein Q8N94_09900, partial [Methanoregula sp.]|nr:hypothetical protein [Methanoregula sp.]
ETLYEYGDANLVDCQIELRDSLEKGYIHECRAVIVEWDNGKRSVLVTSLCEPSRKVSPNYIF